MVTDKIIAIIGPTASGKTRRAVDCALEFNGEIISGDSRQIYRGMSIGSGKDLEEYGDVPYHLIDICDAGYRYNLYEYIRDFHESYQDIRRRGKTVVLCGGSGLYMESVLSGIRLPEVPKNESLRLELGGKNIEELKGILESKKQLHNITDIDSPSRAIRAIEIQEYYENNPQAAADAARQTAKPLDAVIIGVDIDRENRRQRITRRLKERIDNGMIGEICALLDSGIMPEDLMYYGLEYKYVTLYVVGKLSKDEMFSQLETAIHQFAKRQMTWFRGMQRRGFAINWLPWNLTREEFILKVKDLL